MSWSNPMHERYQRNDSQINEFTPKLIVKHLTNNLDYENVNNKKPCII